MVTKEFIQMHSDQVQASIREFNHQGLDIHYQPVEDGFEVWHDGVRFATVGFHGSQPAIRVTAAKRQGAFFMVGDTATDLAGELVMIVIGQLK